MLPSPHLAPFINICVVQVAVQIVHGSVEPYGHVASVTVLWSSHCSGPAIAPSPHTLPARFSTRPQSCSQAVQIATPYGQSISSLVLPSSQVSTPCLT